MQPPEKLRRYPHMFPLDIDIWERFLDTYGFDFEGFEYDVKVGSGTQPSNRVSPRYAKMQQDLSRYRIDVVAHAFDHIEVLEVKPRASASALGQIITYLELFVKDYKPSLPVRGGIVTNQEMPDMRELTTKRDLLYYVI